MALPSFEPTGQCQGSMSNSPRRISKASALWRELVIKIHQVGVGGTLKLGARSLLRKLRDLIRSPKTDLHPFDLKHGTDTSGIVEVGALDLPQDRLEHAIRYQTALVEVFTALLNEVTIPYQEFVFIDLGSGKGRALLLASQFPFKSIIGVELAPHLHSIACENIAVYRDEAQQCFKIQSVCADAASYKIPGENVVFYLFNPFDAQVMSGVLLNIEHSLRVFPRTIYVLYLKALQRQVFDQSKFFRVLKETERYVVYEGRPVAHS